MASQLGLFGDNSSVPLTSRKTRKSSGKKKVPSSKKTQQAKTPVKKQQGVGHSTESKSYCLEQWVTDKDGVHHRVQEITYQIVEPEPGSRFPQHPCNCCGGRTFITRDGVFCPQSQRGWLCIRCHPPIPRSTVAMYELEVQNKDRQDAE